MPKFNLEYVVLSYTEGELSDGILEDLEADNSQKARLKAITQLRRNYASLVNVQIVNVIQVDE
ncbi:hypothetical protein NYR70_02315 [Actinobacillus equuli subsp. equuli]|uniref:hypothetical protein n=1 Tax=Actinobacillus equuli TaxID=718 RepID=UPI0024421B2F|nr:hypothetical protein [Actinobacillus equuli]WGE55531.1 hypothetical protein NYR70_02315 [Actinobacillus equuli subsp. equuli]WGE57620.1 hypothetical protein NYR71_02360 [Actinobacillus equuli subsp. equuli]